MMRPELIDKLVVVDSSPFVNKNSIQVNVGRTKVII
jgi:hypothetical protein